MDAPCLGYPLRSTSMTPESVRRETLLLASGRWVGPWEVALRLAELDRTLPTTEIMRMAEATLAGLAHQGCLRFIRGDPTLSDGEAPRRLSRDEVSAAIRSTGWRMATPADDVWFALTPKGERVLAHEVGQRMSIRRTRDLTKVIAGLASVVRRIVRGQSRTTTDHARGAGHARRDREDQPGTWGLELRSVITSWPDVGSSFDDDAGLASAPVRRGPPDGRASGAAAAVPEPDYEFEIEMQRIA